MSMRAAYQNMMAVLAMLCLLAGFVGLVWMSWRFGRVIHFKFAYRAMVQDTVREMVKAEALR